MSNFEHDLLSRELKIQHLSWVPVAHTILATQEAEIRRIQKKNPIENRAGGVAQMIACLPSKCEALTSNPSTAKKEKEKKLQHFNKDRLILSG
jgi:hypothetical protein